MKFYSIPLLASICILFLVLRKDKTLQKNQKTSIFLLLAIGGMGFVYSIYMIFQKNITPFISVFLFVAVHYQFSVSCFVNLQEKEHLFTQKVAYAILVVFWISLVVCFFMEATEIQRFLDSTSKG